MAALSELDGKAMDHVNTLIKEKSNATELAKQQASKALEMAEELKKERAARQTEQSAHYVVPVSLGNAKNAYATRKIHKVDLYLSNKTLHNFPRDLRRFLGTR